jgi:hypothetical protein
MTPFEKTLHEARWGTHEAYAYQVLKFLKMETVLSIRKIDTLKAILQYCGEMDLKFYNHTPNLPTDNIPYGDTYYLYVALRPNSTLKYIQIKRKLTEVPCNYRKEPFEPRYIPVICYKEPFENLTNKTKNKKVELVKEEEKDNNLSSEAKEIIENSLKILEALNNNLKKLL